MFEVKFNWVFIFVQELVIERILYNLSKLHAPLSVIARACPEAIQNYMISIYRSFHSGFTDSISFSFAFLEPPLICFSLAIASLINLNGS